MSKERVKIEKSSLKALEKQDVFRFCWKKTANFENI